MLLITPPEVISMAFLPRENISPSSIRILKIDIAQEQYILPRFGELMFAKMCDGGYCDFLENYIKPALCHYVRAALIDELSIGISENGAMLLDSEVIGLKSVTAQTDSSFTASGSEAKLGEMGRSSSETTSGTANSIHDSEHLGEKYTLTPSLGNSRDYDNYNDGGTEQLTTSDQVVSTGTQSDDINTQTQKEGADSATDSSNENQSNNTYRAATSVERRVLWSRAISDANVLIAKAVRYVERNSELFPLYEKNSISSKLFF